MVLRRLKTLKCLRPLANSGNSTEFSTREQTRLWGNRAQIRAQARSRESKVCVAVLVERKTRFYRVIHMNDKTSSAMHEFTNDELSTNRIFVNPITVGKKGT
jgi:IS30 family transposase